MSSMQASVKQLIEADINRLPTWVSVGAVIMALETLKRPSRVILHTDSLYLRDGITDWIRRWKRNGWRTSGRAAVKNVDLWQRLDAALARHDVQFRWVRGHSGHEENTRADALARAAIPSINPTHLGGGES